MRGSIVNQGSNQELKAQFMERHGDILTAGYWRGVQDALVKGGAPSLSPYSGGAAILGR